MKDSENCCTAFALNFVARSEYERVAASRTTFQIALGAILHHDGLDGNGCAMDERKLREELQGIARTVLLLAP